MASAVLISNPSDVAGQPIMEAPNGVPKSLLRDLPQRNEPLSVKRAAVSNADTVRSTISVRLLSGSASPGEREPTVCAASSIGGQYAMIFEDRGARLAQLLPICLKAGKIGSIAGAGLDGVAEFSNVRTARGLLLSRALKAASANADEDAATIIARAIVFQPVIDFPRYP